MKHPAAFFVALVLWVVATLFMMFGWITSSDWTVMTKWAFASFVAADVGQRYIDMRLKKPPPA